MSNDDSSVSRGAKIITEPEEATGSNDASTCIFVGGIGKNFTIEELKSLFEPYGTVVSAYVQRSKTTNKPLGYGFVNLATREEAERCIRSCHRKPLFGQAITVSWAERNRCLLVMHIPPTVTLDEIITLFETNGTIDRDESEEGQADCGRYIMLTFRERSDAEACRVTFNGCNFRGGILKVVWYQEILLKRPEPALAISSKSVSVGQLYGAGYHPSRGQWLTCSIHVRFFANSGIHVTESLLSDIFESFGKVIEVTIRRTFSDQNGCVNRGYGFVHFPGDDSGRAAAFAAVDRTNHLEINGILLQTEISNHTLNVYGRPYLDQSSRISLPYRDMIQHEHENVSMRQPFDPRRALSISPQSAPRLLFQYATTSQVYPYASIVPSSTTAAPIPTGYIYVHPPHLIGAYRSSTGVVYPRNYR